MNIKPVTYELFVSFLLKFSHLHNEFTLIIYVWLNFTNV